MRWKRGWRQGRQLEDADYIGRTRRKDNLRAYRRRAIEHIVSREAAGGDGAEAVVAGVEDADYISIARRKDDLGAHCRRAVEL